MYSYICINEKHIHKAHSFSNRHSEQSIVDIYFIFFFCCYWSRKCNRVIIALANDEEISDNKWYAKKWLPLEMTIYILMGNDFWQIQNIPQFHLSIIIIKRKCQQLYSRFTITWFPFWLKQLIVNQLLFEMRLFSVARQ